MHRGRGGKQYLKRSLKQKLVYSFCSGCSAAFASDSKEKSDNCSRTQRSRPAFSTPRCRPSGRTTASTSKSVERRGNSGNATWSIRSIGSTVGDSNFAEAPVVSAPFGRRAKAKLRDEGRDRGYFSAKPLWPSNGKSSWTICRSREWPPQVAREN